MQQSTRRILTSVVEKAARLKENRYIEQLRTKPRNLHIQFTTGKDPKITLTGIPENESIDALITNLRFFMQCKERTSFYRLEELTRDKSISKSWTDGYRETRLNINIFLDSPPPMVGVIDGVATSSYRWIYELFVYGEISHQNPDKYETLKKWKNNPAFCATLQFYFIDAVTEILKAIFVLSRLCEEELKTTP
jgi:hypothetical protein